MGEGKRWIIGEMGKKINPNFHILNIICFVFFII